MMKVTRFSPLLLIFSAFNCYAAAGFADAYHDRQQWIFPAYFYCLIFGLLILSGLFILSLICRTKTKEISSTISAYLIRHRILAIIVTGVLLAIPLGIMGSVSWEIIWFLSILPALALMLAFPMSLVNRTFREKYLLSPFILKWSFMISISAILASFLFIVLTNRNMLSGTDVTYLARPDRLYPEFYHPTHPYDSMKEIWSITILFIVEIPISILLYWFGLLNRFLCRKLSAIRRRKQETFNDIYTGE